MTTAIARHNSIFDWFTVEKAQAFLVSMIFISSFYVKFEPAPCDVFFGITLIFCLGSGLNLTTTIMPLFLFLLIYNFAGLFSYMLVPYDALDSTAYLIGLAETSVSGVFFAAYIAADPVRRYEQIIRAYWIGATIGAALGLCSYFRIEQISTLFPDFAGRALGGYKDPSVFSTWLVLPAITMLQGIILGTLRVRLLSVTSFLLIFLALFLAFSRGAWINAVMATVMMAGLTFLLSPSNGLRSRIVFSTVFGFVFLAVAIAILLSIPATRDLFLDRFTLVKDYDTGETGRFGNQLNAISMLVQLPFGFGPYQFAAIFNLAPHNTFLNSFASTGWVGGFAYILLVVSNFFIGFKTVLLRTPFQPAAIAVYSCLVAVTLQDVQIDTEHWRHMYWMTGIVWGFFSASFAYMHTPPSLAEIVKTWNFQQRGSTV